MDRLTKGTHWFREPRSARRYRLGRSFAGKRRMQKGRRCSGDSPLGSEFSAKRRWFLDRLWRRGEDPGPGRRELDAICHECAL
jgi:hypothetical protein